MIEGLYYKLHGCYRPSTMKKTIIKRRKRVVPALRDQSPSGAMKSSPGSSTSPEASPGASVPNLEDQHRYLGSEIVNDGRPLSAGRISPQAVQHSLTITPPPPPVDFTGYSSNPISLPHHPPPPPRLLKPDGMNSSGQPPNAQFSRRSTSPRAAPLPMAAGNTKKRTIAEATSMDAVPIPAALDQGSNQLPPIISSPNPAPPARLSSISSLLNHTDVLETSRLDPSLSPLSRPPQRYSPSPIPHPPSGPVRNEADIDNHKAERRAQLKREAEEMREALKAKERELAELES